MGIIDAFKEEDRIQVKFTTLYGLMKNCVCGELLMNAVRCDVPHKHIREMATGEKEQETVDPPVLNPDPVGRTFTFRMMNESEEDDRRE